MEKIINTNKAYIIKKDTIRKIINVEFLVAPSGNGEDGIRFVQDLGSLVKTINTNEYQLVLNCLKFGVFKPELLPILEQCYKLYKDCGFKEVVTIVNQLILSMQLKRIGKKVGLNIVVDLKDNK